MKIFLTNSKKAAPFKRKWAKYKNFFTFSLMEDVVMIVEENLERAYVSDTGMLHVPMGHFGYYIGVIDDLMEGIQSRKIGARDVYQFLMERLK